MIEAQEEKLIEALKKVDMLGDIAPTHVQDPMTMVLRYTALQADLMRWDESRCRYVLTVTGRSRISARPRVRSVIVNFANRKERKTDADKFNPNRTLSKGNLR